MVPYSPEYRDDFKTLNEAWIRKYFKMEESDYKSLDHPQSTIIEPGGYIVMAIEDGVAVGTCALIKMADGGYELAKMAVTDSTQGKGVGGLIGQHLVEKGKEFGATRLFLESNTKLTPAINLYRKLGFKQITDKPSCYSRCNIQMELVY